MCSTALGELDKGLYNRLKRLLGVESPACDNLVREAALKSTAVLVRKYVRDIIISTDTADFELASRRLL